MFNINNKPSESESTVYYLWQKQQLEQYLMLAPKSHPRRAT